MSYDEGVRDDQGIYSHILQALPISIYVCRPCFRVVHQSDRCILSGEVVLLFWVASGNSSIAGITVLATLECLDLNFLRLSLDYTCKFLQMLLVKQHYSHRYIWNY